MSDTQTFTVKIPERPNGKSIICCFDSLKNQMVAAGVLNNRLTRFRVNTKEKQLEIEIRRD